MIKCVFHKQKLFWFETELIVNNFKFLFVKYTIYHCQDQLVAGSQPGGILKAWWNYMMWQYISRYISLNLTERICNSLDNGQFSCEMSIDLQKAFDTIDHELS